jgi:enoyl-CoA hydratase/carnithine racemase
VVWSLAETGMGIMPGGGGVVRVTRMAGIAATVLDIVGPGTAFHPTAALAAGLVDELSGDVVAAARAWVLAQPEGPFVQRWERPGYAIPGGTDEPVGLADEVRRRSAGSPVRALAAVRDVAVRIPVVVRGTGTSFVQALLDAGPDPTAMAAAARRAVDGGLDIDPAAADVASVLAAGFPPWTGGVLHQLSAR